MATNNLESVLLTGVKFYASKTKAEALALPTTPLYDDEGNKISDGEPGAICFVSDGTGNYIILNGKIFGDGAVASSTSGGSSSGGSSSGGAVDSVNGKTGVVVIGLGDIAVTTEGDGTTLSDYFSSDGSILSLSFIARDSDGNAVVTIDRNGVKIGTEYVLTTGSVDTIKSDIESDLSTSITAAETNAKAYADTLVTSVYRVKGSKATLAALSAVSGPEVGDVYNVTANGMNYVWNGDQWDALGASVDTSDFYTKTEIDSKITDLNSKIETSVSTALSTLLSEIDTNASAISGLSSIVTANSGNIATNTNNITTNTTNINNLSNQLKWQ